MSRITPGIESIQDRTSQSYRTKIKEEENHRKLHCVRLISCHLRIVIEEMTRKALSGGRTEYLVSGVTYLVSNSGLLFIHVSGSGYPSFTLTFSRNGTFFSRDLELRPVTLTYEFDLGRANANHGAKDQRSFRQLSGEHRHRHIHSRSSTLPRPRIRARSRIRFVKFPVLRLDSEV